MPDTFIRFSDMKDSHPSPIDGVNDLLAIAHKDTNSPTGYNSMTVTPNALGAHAVEDQTFVNLETGVKTVEGAINQTLGNFANKYDPTQTYAVDDCVLYSGILYKCIVAIYIPEAWDITHWEQIKAIDVGSGGGGGGSSTLAGLTDVNISFPSNYQSLIFDNATGKWINGVAPHNYSTNERLIGTWIDGKPLYEKTFYSSTVVGFNTDTDMTLNDTIPTGIDVVETIGSIDMSAPSARWASSSAKWFSWYVDITDNVIRASQNLTSGALQSCYTTFTLRYTKQTT